MHHALPQQDERGAVRDDGTDDRLPSLCFDAGALPRGERFPAWCEAVGALFDVVPPRRAAAADHPAALTAHHLGSVVLCRWRSGPGRYARSDIRIQWDDLDHYLVHLPLRGMVACVHDGTVARLRPMDVVLFDLSRPLTLLTGGGEALSLVVPRPALPDASPHGRVLSGRSPVGSLLGHHLAALAREVPRLPRADAANMAAASAGLVAACLGMAGKGGGPGVAVPAQPTLGRRVRAYIERNLHLPALGPEALMNDLGVSRSQLYRQFERFGGVQHYIRHRRLRRSLMDVCDPVRGQRRIADLAYDHGFADEAHFSRLFRQAFGMSPRAARNAARRGEPLALAILSGDSLCLSHWLRDLAP
ncbi:MAG: helix-turn-helix domain-containing protein [Bacteroidales bacterium]